MTDRTWSPPPLTLRYLARGARLRLRLAWAWVRFWAVWAWPWSSKSARFLTAASLFGRQFRLRCHRAKRRDSLGFIREYNEVFLDSLREEILRMEDPPNG